jgi:hypothetical protein
VMTHLKESKGGSGVDQEALCEEVTLALTSGAHNMILSLSLSCRSFVT